MVAQNINRALIESSNGGRIYTIVHTIIGDEKYQLRKKKATAVIFPTKKQVRSWSMYDLQ